MKTRSLILIGLISCLFFAIALLPASLVWHLAGRSLMGLPVSVEQVGGTVWNGYLKGRLGGQLPPGPVVVRWDLQGLKLLMGEVALELHVEGSQYRIGGDGYWGLWGEGLTGFNGNVQVELLRQMLAQFDVSAGGEITLSNISARLRGRKVTAASGSVGWTGGKVSVRGPSPQTLDFPGVKGELAQEQGNLIVHVTETRSNKPLGELSLMPEQGLAGVKVLKRVLSLAGMNTNGGDDKVLLNLQQPLPF